MNGTAPADGPRTANIGRFEGTAIVFLTSAASLIVEIVAGRMLAPFVGMSLYTWTSVIAVVLAGLSLGHWIGGIAAERYASRPRPFLAIVLVVAAASTLAAIVILPAVSGALLTRFDTAVTGITALALAGFFIPSVAAGIPSPIIAAGLVEADPDRKGRALGGLFAAGAIGAIAGTLSAGFVFISWIGSTKTLIACAAIYGALAVVVALRARKPVASGVILAAVALGASGYALREQARFCDVESRYFCIRTVDITHDAGEPARVMILDHLAHSMSVERDPQVLLSPYIWMADRIARAEKGNDFSSFFVGGGAYSLPRAWAARGMRPVIAEIDPAVTKVAARDFWFDPASAEVIHRDARVALRAMNARRFDVIVGDAFTDVAVPAHLVTREFAELVASRLAVGGIYILHFVAPETRLDALFAMIRTLRTEFAGLDVWLDTDASYPQGRRSFLFVARTSATASPDYGDTGTWRRLEPDDLMRRVAEADPPLLTDDFAPIDRLVGMAQIGID